MFHRCQCYYNVWVTIGDGKGIGSKALLTQRIFKKIKLLLYPLYISASIDRMSGVMLESIYRNIKKHQYKDMTIIIHPKETTNHSLVFYSMYISLAKKDGCQFKTTNEIDVKY